MALSLDWFDRLGMKPDYIEARALLERLEQNQASIITHSAQIIDAQE